MLACMPLLYFVQVLLVDQDVCSIWRRTWLIWHWLCRILAVHFPIVQSSMQLMGAHGRHACRLIALKNVFSKQLPNMPREYIARLVLDRNHRSVALAKGKCSALGGITYR